MADEESFERRKAASLKAILNACEFDKSPKGSVDEPIRTLVDTINKSNDLATTSSCSGRISLYHTSGSETNKKGSGKWLLALHRCLANSSELITALEEGLRDVDRSEPSTTIFKHEPFVLHVMCRSVDIAQAVLKVAMDAGFRESGLSVGARKIMVGIRTTSNSLECPIAHDGQLLCSKEYLEYLTLEANKRFLENQRRTRHFEDMLEGVLENKQKQPTFEISPELPKRLSWTELGSGNNLLKRWGHSAVELDSKRVLIFGGWGESLNTSSSTMDKQQHTHLSHSLILDVGTGRCRPLSGPTVPIGRMYHSSVKFGTNNCLVFGGRKSPQSSLDDWWMFEGDSELWFPITPSPTVKSLPPSRWRHAMVAVDDSIVVYGGRTLDRVLDDLWKLRVAKSADGKWSILASEHLSNNDTEAPGPRFAHAMVSYNGKIYTHGGLGNFSASTGPDEVWCYELASQSWSRVVVPGLSWRFSHSWNILDRSGSQSIILGGVGEEYVRNNIRAVDALQVDLETFKTSVMTFDTISSIFAVQNASVAIDDGRSMLLLGGGATCFAFGSVFGSSAYVRLDDAIDSEPSATVVDLVSTNKDDSIGFYWSCNKIQAVGIKRELADAAVLDKSRKVITEAESILFPITRADITFAQGQLVKRENKTNMPPLGNRQQVLSRDDALRLVVGEAKCKAERVDDVVLIHSKEFSGARASEIEQALWTKFLSAFPGATRVVWGAEVDTGTMRQSRHRLLYSAKPSLDECWVTVKENSVQYSFDMLRCMFSKGNVSEKARFASLIQPGEIVVDLFAGIGYFSVSCLALSPNARLLHACEWNPDAVRALRVNLKLNGVQHRCKVYPGDCRSLRLHADERAHRVSLGLLPTSRVGWETALKCLRDEGGWLHVHENVAETDIEGMRERLEATFNETVRRLRGPEWGVKCKHVQRVKSYAPRVYHVVFDIDCRPSDSVPPLVHSNSGIQMPEQFLQNVENESSAIYKLRSALRKTADDLVCAAGRAMEVETAESIAADAEMLFRRIRRRLRNDF